MGGARDKKAIWDFAYRLTVAQIASIIEEDEAILDANIYIEPPENPDLSDGDSDDEDATGDINKLSGHQLRAGAVCSFTKITDHGLVRVRTDEENYVPTQEETYDDDFIPGTPSPHKKTSKERFRVIGEVPTFEDSTSVSNDVAIDISNDVPNGVPMSIPNDVPTYVTMDISSDIATEVPIDANTDVAMDVPIEIPIDVPTHVPTTTKHVINKTNRKMKQASKQTKQKGNKDKKVTNPNDNKTPVTGKKGNRNVAKKAKKTKRVRNWKKQDIPNKSSIEFSRPTYLEKDFSPVEAFEYFFDDEVCDYIVECTNQYAVEKGNLSFAITKDELRIYFAILFLSGYVVLSRTRMFWELSDDVHNAAVANAMSRNRFEDIMRYLHFCKNAELQDNDRFGKIKPVMCMLNERWLQYFPGDAYLSIDESMVPYYGRYGAKQHIHGKPIRFGYKIWILATRLGYVVQGEPYQGKGSTKAIPELGLGGSVVMDLLSDLPQDRQYSLFFDNFFTSFRLLDALKNKGYDGTGTVRADRVEDAPLPNATIMKKEVRGTYHQVTDVDTGITLVRFRDNNVFTMASTSAGVAPKGKAKRWSKAHGRYMALEQPACVSLYNTYMGGVDRADQNIATYRISIRNKKWYWPMVSYLLSVSMNNAWLLFRMNPQGREENLDFLAFIRYVVKAYLAKYRVSRPSAGRPSTKVASRVLPEVRYSGRGHFCETVAKQVRCAQCGKATRKKCKVCQVGIHTNCNEEFHSR